MLTRSQLIERLNTKQTNLIPRDVEEATKKIFRCMTESLSEGHRIEIRGFGSFSLRTRRKYTARNPKTGQTFELSSKSVIYFRPGKKLREAVNNARGRSATDHFDQDSQSVENANVGLSESSQSDKALDQFRSTNN